MLFISAAVDGSLQGQTQKQIAAIRSEVNQINKNALSYTKMTRNIEGLSTEGSVATYFLSGKGLKKITAKIYGETFNTTTELYYSGEELIFAFQKASLYERPIGGSKTPKIVRVRETRLYRDGGKSIRILLGKIELKQDDVKYTETEYEIIELADQLKAAVDRLPLL